MASVTGVLKVIDIGGGELRLLIIKGVGY